MHKRESRRTRSRNLRTLSLMMALSMAVSMLWPMGGAGTYATETAPGEQVESELAASEMTGAELESTFSDAIAPESYEAVLEVPSGMNALLDDTVPESSADVDAADQPETGMADETEVPTEGNASEPAENTEPNAVPTEISGEMTPDVVMEPATEETGEQNEISPETVEVPGTAETFAEETSLGETSAGAGTELTSVVSSEGTEAPAETEAPVTEESDETAEEEPAFVNQKLSDEAGMVSVSGMLPENARVSVSKLGAAAAPLQNAGPLPMNGLQAFMTVQSAPAPALMAGTAAFMDEPQESVEEWESLGCYDIKILDMENVSVQPDGTVTVTVNGVPYEKGTLRVRHILDDVDAIARAQAAGNCTLTSIDTFAQITYTDIEASAEAAAEAGAESGYVYVETLSAWSANPSSVSFKTSSFSIYLIEVTGTDEVITYEMREGDTLVHIDAAGDAFPAGSYMDIHTVELGEEERAVALASAVQELETINAEIQVQAVDISFYDADGNPIQPAKPVAVRLTPAHEVGDDFCVIHMGESGASPVEASKASDGAVVFMADGFSVYAVVGEGADVTEARATVNFYGKNLTTPIATIYVKNGDTLPELEMIIYDPGSGPLDEGDLFKGWSISTVDTDDGKNYTTETEAKSIDEIREFFAGLTVKEGQTYNLYAMIFKAYSIQYKDEDGVTIHSEVLINKTAEPVTYTINMPYTPKSQDAEFQGWYWSSTTDNAVVPTDSGLTVPYPNETEVQISGNVVFTPRVPNGFWLSFNENGSAASYTPPQFIQSGNVTTRPSDPTRFGYTFGGWYTDAACSAGNEFTFGQQMTARTTVYAKWTPIATANYTVIIWKQNIEGTGYDFAESITLSGTVNTKVNAISQQGTGDNAYARIVGRPGGQDVSYTGFHLKEFDSSVSIVPEGTSVVNVYYDRNEYTLTFQAKGYIYTETTSNDGTQYGYYNGDYVQLYYNNGTWYRTRTWWWDSYYYSDAYSGTRYTRSGGNNTWSTIKTITARYQQNIASNFPIVGKNGVTYNNGERWEPQSSTPYSEVLVFIDVMPAANVTFHLNEADRPLKTMNWYVEALPTETGQTVTAPNKLYEVTNNNTVSASGKQFVLYKSISARYNGVTPDEDFIDIDGFTKIGADSKWDTRNGTKFYIYDDTYNGTVNFYYTRDSYVINYMDGVYVDGNNNLIDETSHGQWDTSDDIYYQADISSYNKGRADYYVPTRAGYAFEGWYLDDSCTQPYTFTTMPKGGVTVYAKWRQVQYRVFMHPNVPSEDTTLDWGGQAMSYRVNYGEQIAGGSTINGTRDEYELIGWYTDADCTKPFNFEAYTLNDTTVTATYDKTEPTELDKYGNPTGPENRDEGRFWINKKLDLYAKWRATLDGAKGIDVVYSGNDTKNNISGTSTYVDPLDYLDNAEAVAGAAATPDDDKYQFLYWVVQTWDEASGEYVDTDVKVYPGDAFTVLKANAHRTDNPNTTGEDDKYLYTVQLRAEYGPKDEPTPTHIRWYANGGKADSGATQKTDTDLQINEAVDIEPYDLFTREGYKFLGWARVDVTTADGTHLPNYDTPIQDDTLGEEDLFLKYENGKYYANIDANGDGNIDWTEVTQVAADETDPYHDLYAVWQRTYTVTVVKEVDGLNSDQTRSFTFTPTIDGTAKTAFALTHGQSQKFEELSYNSVFNVAETANADFDVEVTCVKTKDKDGKECNVEVSLTDGADLTIEGDYTITYKNIRKNADVSIQKVVAGNMGDQSKVFSFTVTAVHGSETVELASTDSSFTLGHDAIHTIENVPVGAVLTITEANADGYTTTYMINNGESADAAEHAVTYTVIEGTNNLVITNTKLWTPDTGRDLDSMPYLWLLSLIAGAAMMLPIRRKKEEEL